MIVGREDFVKYVKGLKRMTQVVELPELGDGVQVKVREISASERDAFEEELTEIVNGKRVQKFENFRARLVVRSLVDEHGNRIFNNEDADLIGNMPVSVIEKIFSVAQKLSGLTNEDLNEIRKNCAPTTGDASSSE